MRRLKFASFLLVVVSAFLVYGFAANQSQQVDRKQLRDMLVQLGYEVKDLVTEVGKEKYAVTITKDGLDIPIGYEISPSSTYIWLTVNLGQPPAESSAKNLALLKQNTKIQPTFFYVTDAGRLMVGLPIDNRGVTNAILRQRSESIVDSVVRTKDIWTK
ncbi:MAG: hypothetical protein M3R13_07495 [Armatimonadota bacterium]|nr:hypothetical protein [Armatimonadota bacterium]